MWKENEKKPVIPFLLITFGITYSAELLVILLEHFAGLPETAMKTIAMTLISVCGALAPGFSVYVLLKKNKKISGLKDYMKRVFYCKSKKSFFSGTLTAFVIFGVFVILIEKRHEEFPLYIAPLLLLLMIPGGGWEELGWRGFLQPALESKAGFFPATFVTASIWTVWHLPLWLISSANQKLFFIPSFALYCLALSFLLAATYRITKSTFSAILVHAWGNTMCGGLFTFSVLQNVPDMKAIVLFSAVTAVSIAMYFFADKKLNFPKISSIHFGKKHLAQTIPFDREKQEAVIKCSVCTGEQTACFKDKTGGKLTEVMLIKTDEDLKYFMKTYDIEKITKEY